MIHVETKLGCKSVVFLQVQSDKILLGWMFRSLCNMWGTLPSDVRKAWVCIRASLLWSQLTAADSQVIYSGMQMEQGRPGSFLQATAFFIFIIPLPDLLRNCVSKRGFQQVTLLMKSSLGFCNRPHSDEKIYSWHTFNLSPMFYGDPNCKVTAIDLSHILLSFPSEETHN
jgi:hypothetical protein